MTDDYYLSNQKNVVKGCDNIGADMYVLTEGVSANGEKEVCVNQLDFNNLSAGVQQKKLLWETSEGDKDGYTLIKRLDSIGIWAFTRRMISSTSSMRAVELSSVVWK